MEKMKKLKEWIIYIDSFSNNKSNGAGLILIGPDGQKIKYIKWLQLPTINNIAKYEAIILNLELAKEVGVTPQPK